MTKRVILVTGGQRSGKSSYAQERALSLSPNPVYVATSRIWDEDFRQRVIRHQNDRGPMWTNIEEEKHLAKLDVTERVVVVDCVTLWATNFFFDNNSNIDKTLEELKHELSLFCEQNATILFITNEIGMGGHAENEIQRKFTDMQGWLNQHIASIADEVILMVSGIAVKIK